MNQVQLIVGIFGIYIVSIIISLALFISDKLNIFNFKGNEYLSYNTFIYMLLLFQLINTLAVFFVIAHGLFNLNKPLIKLAKLLIYVYREIFPKYAVITLSNGEVHNYRNNKLHRINGPAVIRANGDHLWYYKGKLHNFHNGPAEILDNGSRHYYRHGVRHRTGGPAVENTKNNTWAYYVKGKLHRTGGPAEYDASENTKWYRHGKLHRTGGPAVTNKSGYTAYYVNGKKHRTDGPAIVTTAGDAFWYQYDVLHREDGPADIQSRWVYKDNKNVLVPDAIKQYYHNGKLHRLDGPAFISPVGVSYYIDGKEYTELEYLLKTHK